MKNIYTKDLNIPKDWEDTFNGNDAMYSYEIGNFRIWIDHPNSEESELFIGYSDIREYERFAVVCSDKYIDENPNDHYVDDVLFSSNDFNEVIAYTLNHVHTYLKEHK